MTQAFVGESGRSKKRMSIIADLEGLPIDEFFEESFNQWLLRDPEGITYLGLADELGVRNDKLTDISDTYIKETQELEKGILDLLQTYDRDALTPEQKLSYDVYEWFLDDLVRGHEFMYYTYPVHHFLTGFHDQLVRFFSEVHPLTKKQDAEDYLSRLSQLDTKISQLLEGLALREEAGVILPKFIIEIVKRLMKKYLYINGSDSVKAEEVSLCTVFCEKLDSISELSAEEKEAFRRAALKEVEEAFIPAYVGLLDYLEYLATKATDEAGVWKFPKGDAYYTYMLRHETSTELTAEEIHEIGLQEVDRIHRELHTLFSQLGYPEDESLSNLMKRAIEEGGFYDTTTQKGKDQVIKAYEKILEDIDQLLNAVVDIRPREKVVVIGEPVPGGGGGFYESPSKDGSRPGRFHTVVGGPRILKYRMPGIAYHEAIPGHHFQVALARELDLPRFRNYTDFNGYTEGWALYAERLAYELGVYEDDPYGNVGRLQLELLRAVRLVVDTGIHAKKWTREEAKEYMDEALGAENNTVSFEVDRFVVLPGQATGYMVGMLKILELRQKAMDALGDHFDLKEFHNTLLKNGSMPLDILEQVVQDYIEARAS